MTRTYVETSALLLGFLQVNEPMRTALAEARAPLTSTLTVVEVHRALGRRQEQGVLDARQAIGVLEQLRRYLQTCELIGLTREVRDHAARTFPENQIRTLDAIHVASVLVAAQLGTIQVLATDRRVASNCRALGFEVFP